MLQRRKNQVDTEEHRFLKSFLETDFFRRFSRSTKNDLAVIEEPYTGFGYADAVGVIYDKAISETWSDARNALQDDDIKILHHLYLTKKGRCPERLIFELGFPPRRLNKAVDRLARAELIVQLKDGRLKNQPVNKIFFLKEIVAVEAKLRDWKGALIQSQNNLSFCSRSYSLFPATTLRPHIKGHYAGTGVGIVTHGSHNRIEVDSTKRIIPSNLSSWYFNEYIGRTLS